MSDVWYEDGLRFECTRCGKCCSGFPGFVWVNNEELQAIADARGEPLEEVIGLYTRMVHGRHRFATTSKTIACSTIRLSAVRFMKSGLANAVLGPFGKAISRRRKIGNGRPKSVRAPVMGI